ncbi:MAG: ATP-grasp domain-containing protein [Phycisphaerales bacterium]|nr:ATP-grasp domain-containing protein [Phycisphaerales bacterium]
MQAHWLIENNIFDYTESLIAELERQSLPVKLFDYTEGQNDAELLAAYPGDACVIAHGSLGFCRCIRESSKWRPGAWCNFERIKYTAYSQHWSEFLLNKDVAIVAYADFMEQYRRDIAASRAVSKFVRPDSGAKEFPGLVVTTTNFEQSIGWYEEDVSPELPVIVADLHEIAREWRFIVCGDKVITGCEYAIVNGRREPGAGHAPEAAQFAQRVASGEFRPDVLYVLDVCETAASPGRYFVLEPNSFSGSDWYSCDLATIVSTASETGLAEWQNRFSKS